jgi:hypothetical protein
MMDLALGYHGGEMRRIHGIFSQYQNDRTLNVPIQAHGFMPRWFSALRTLPLALGSTAP